MKKLMSLLLILTMTTTNAMAVTQESNSSHDQMINKAFNEFRYKMTVSVDPNDKNFKEQALNEFKSRMIDLQKKGVSPTEIMDHMRNSILDASTRADFDRMLVSMSATGVSGEDAGNLAMQFMASKYQQGAGYSGGGSSANRAIAIILGVVIVGVVTYLVYRYQQNRTDTVTNTSTQTNTVTDTDTITDTDTVTDTQTQTETLTIVDCGPSFALTSPYCDD